MVRAILVPLAAALSLVACSSAGPKTAARPAATFAAVTFTPTPSPTPSPTPPPSPTPSPTSAPTPSPTPSPTAAAALIRATDWSRVVAEALHLDGASGSVNPADVRYADLTGDGVEEAIVPVQGNGNAGTIGYYVFGLKDGQLVRLLARRGEGIGVSVEDGGLVETIPDYAPGDPRCCPSRLRRTVYGWTGSALAPERSEVVSNPNR